MDVLRPRISIGFVLGSGILLGWMLSVPQPVALRASAGDRSGESILATGPVLVRYDETSRAPIPLDAVYFLDYTGGRLLATIPSYRQTGRTTHLLHGFAERDLAADFKLDRDGGPRPRFLMTTGSIGQYSSGWAPLYVFETTTGQVAVYRLDASVVAGSTTQSRFELLELQSYAKAESGDPRPGTKWASRPGRNRVRRGSPSRGDSGSAGANWEGLVGLRRPLPLCSSGGAASAGCPLIRCGDGLRAVGACVLVIDQPFRLRIEEIQPVLRLPKSLNGSR